MQAYSNYDDADEQALAVVTSGQHRIMFVARLLTHDAWVISYASVGHATPVKRYLRDSRGYISVKAVNNWRRN